METGGTFVLEFRDMKSLKDGHRIELGNQSDVQRFFRTCYQVLDQDVELLGTKYNVHRNALSKNVIRVTSSEDDAYLFLRYDTTEKMEKAFERYLQIELK